MGGQPCAASCSRKLLIVAATFGVGVCSVLLIGPPEGVAGCISRSASHSRRLPTPRQWDSLHISAADHCSSLLILSAGAAHRPARRGAAAAGPVCARTRRARAPPTLISS